MRFHLFFNRIQCPFEDICLLGNLVFEKSNLMHSLTDQTFEAVYYLRVKGMVSLDFIYLLNRFVYCLLVLLLGLHSKGDGADERTNEIEIF